MITIIYKHIYSYFVSIIAHFIEIENVKNKKWKNDFLVIFRYLFVYEISRLRAIFNTRYCYIWCFLWCFLDCSNPLLLKVNQIYKFRRRNNLNRGTDETFELEDVKTKISTSDFKTVGLHIFL